MHVPPSCEGHPEVAPSLRMPRHGRRTRERSGRWVTSLSSQACGRGPLLPCPAPLRRSPSNWDLAHQDHLFLSARCHGDGVA